MTKNNAFIYIDSLHQK